MNYILKTSLKAPISMRSKAFGSPELQSSGQGAMKSMAVAVANPPNSRCTWCFKDSSQMVETWWTHGGIFERNLRSKAPGKSWEKDGKKEDECNLLQPICFDIFHLPIPTRL